MKMHKNMTNGEVAQLLRSVAAAYEVNPQNSPNTRFRIIAYEKAADSIEKSTSETKDLYEEGKLDQIPGIGKSIAQHLKELFKAGKVKHFDEVFEKLPPTMFELLDIPGIGAKKAYKLVKELNLKKPKEAVKKLQEAAKKGKIRAIEGFGEQSEKEILEAVQSAKRKTKRFPLPYGKEIAEEILAYLGKNKSAQRADLLGSLRREVSTVGDIDIAVASDNPKEVVKHFISYPKKSNIVEAGDKTASILLPNGMQIDLMVQSPRAYGALLQHFTGSKNHNIALRNFALKKGLSLSEYGIKKGKKLHLYSNEEDFYKALEMDWIPPELREDHGELQAALAHKLPKLAKLEDLKGDLHLHSNFLTEVSHDAGDDSIEDMVKKAQELGYEYALFTEHNPKLDLPTAKILNMLKKKQEHVEKLKRQRKLKGIFNGLEIDIRPDGSLAIPEKGFDYLDIAVVAVHSSFNQDIKSQTARVLKGLEHPKAKILAHPTARKINEREEIQLDWEKILSFCKEKDKWLEINSWPQRLDLPDILVHEAIKNGVKLVISTDSHAVSHMVGMKYGVSVARRGWAQTKDIINTLSYNNFIKLLQ